MSATVKRTTSGLVDALFETMDRLNKREIDSEQARAISHTARTIVAVASLELEYRKFSATAQNVPDGLGALTMDAPQLAA